jgi:hypothetical protein
MASRAEDDPIRRTSRRRTVTGIGQTQKRAKKGHNMSPSEVCVLRTRLRQVNVEYSALVRAGSGEGRFVRMSELRAERKALMTLMADGARGGHRQPVGWQQPSSIALRPAAE